MPCTNRRTLSRQSRDRASTRARCKRDPGSLRYAYRSRTRRETYSADRSIRQSKNQLDKRNRSTEPRHRCTMGVALSEHDYVHSTRNNLSRTKVAKRLAFLVSCSSVPFSTSHRRQRTHRHRTAARPRLNEEKLSPWFFLGLQAPVQTRPLLSF